MTTRYMPGCFAPQGITDFITCHPKRPRDEHRAEVREYLRGYRDIKKRAHDERQQSLFA